MNILKMPSEVSKQEDINHESRKTILKYMTKEHVNSIFQLKDIMAPEGRVSFITFHSLEDRIIKQFIKKNLFSSEYDLEKLPKNLPIKESDINKTQNWKWIIKKQKAEQSECEDNIRSRSATLRVIERVI